MKEQKIPPVHPGEVLLEDFLKPLGISQYRLAKEMNVYPRKINEIVHGERGITANTALRLSFFWPYLSTPTGAFLMIFQIVHLISIDLRIKKDKDPTNSN